MTYPNDELDDALTDAAQNAPYSAPPPALFPAIMSRVRQLAPARFRIRPLDYALSAFVAGMLGLATLIWQLLTPQQLAHLQLEFLRLSHRFSPTTLGLIAVAAAVLVLAAFVVALTVFGRSRSTTR